MENKSIWSKYLETSDKVLDKNILVDVLIIGGGISGVLTAYNLNNSGLKVALVERNEIGSGITSKMTAKVTFLQDILTKIDEKDLDLYLKSQIDGLKILKSIIEDNNLDCSFKKNTSYLYTIKKSNIKKLDKVKKVLEKNKISYQEENPPLSSISVVSSIKIDNSYEINPILYLNQVKSMCCNVDFYEHTNIVEVLKENKKFIVKTENGNTITSKIVVFATNYPYFLKPLFFPIKVKLEKSYIGYGKPNFLTNKDFNCINIDKDVHSIRFYDNKMLYLTGSKINASKVNDAKNFSKLIDNNLIEEIDCMWSNIDLFPSDYLPIMGRIFDNMYILTGYSAWGILSSHVGSCLLASLILKKKKYLKYQELFNPRKKITMKKFVNSSFNVYENINGFLKGIFAKNKLVFYSKDKAIYVSNDGYCYIVKRKCPHLKCNLLFNEVEKTWDCPCHGSRFDLFGNVIAGPSKYNIKVDVK